MKKMKCSMSMSSLDSPAKVLRTPDGPKKSWNSNRLCNTLSTKKPRRTLEKKMYRRSWGSMEEMSQEELWKACLQSVQGLVDFNTDEQGLSLVKDFLEDYARVCDWLNSVQAERSRFADALVLSKLAAELSDKQEFRIEMNERAKALVQSLPKLKEEFQWRVKHMNSQWDALEKILLCQSSAANTNISVPKQNENGEWDINWVRKWLREMENELQPLAFHVQWTTTKLEDELNRHKALQTEIETKSPLVHGVLRQSNSQNQGRTTSGNSTVAPKRVEILERRWIQLRLRVLEWVEHLTRLKQKEASRQKGRDIDTGCQAPTWELSDEDTQEPLNKYPRLGGSQSSLDIADKKFSETLSNIIATGNCDDHCPIGPGSEGLAGGITADLESFEAHEDTNDDYEMGQSHDAEPVYQSGSPVPNSVIEFSFDGTSGSVGLKRKLSPPSSSPPRTFRQPFPLDSPQVVPTMNISTYYFKHSDTEPELSQSRHDSPQECPFVLNNGEPRSPSPPSNIRPRILDFGQDQDPQEEHPLDTDWLKSPTNPSLDLDFELDDYYPEDGIDMMEQETLPFQDLTEIEELVQKADLLVQQSVALNQRTRSMEFGDEEIPDFATRKCFTTSTPNNVASKMSSTKKLHNSKKYMNSATSFAGNVAEGSPSIVTRKQKSMGTCSCPTPLDGAVGGTCLCEVFEASESEGIQIRGGAGTQKNSRVHQWIRAHNPNGNGSIVPELTAGRKNTSSCDASAESTTESESEVSEAEEEAPLSSDDPTTLCASNTYLNQASLLREPQKEGFLKKGGASSHGSVNTFQKSPTASTSGNTVIWRSKKRTGFAKQRPKSFTENLSFHANGGYGQALSPIADLCGQKSSFISDTALNLLGNNSGSWSSSGGGSPSQSNAEVLKEKKKSKFRRRLIRHKKRSSIDFEGDDAESGHLRSSSLFAGGFRDMENQLVEIQNTIPETPTPVKSPVFRRLNSDTTSVHTEEHTNDQDWDSYQEKYLSETYSEEPYDQDRTLKLLAFGEDYDQVLDRADSESSSMLSGFEPNLRKRRPLMLVNRGEMQESDSDREEFNHFLTQSVSQLRFIDVVFRKQLLSSTEPSPEAPEFAEMEATCEENINSLKLILSNVEKPDALPFEIDVKSIQDVLEKWDLLKEKITQAAKLQQIQEEMEILKLNFDSVQQQLGDVDPFDSRDLSSLQYKIGRIQAMLGDLGTRKQRLQKLNEASLGTQVFLKDTGAVADVKKQLHELYALYEENFQLGSYLLEKMRYLEEAWTSFEKERSEFEKSMTSAGLRSNLKSELSSALSTDSGHGTDFSHDSSISDSDMDFQEKSKKLVALRKRASDLKSFLPPGSPVLDIIDVKIDEAQRDFEMLKRIGSTPLDLKIIYPKKRSPISIRKPSLKSLKSINLKSISLVRARSQSVSSANTQTKKEPSRHWRALRFSLTFQFCILGLFAVAWFLQPKCCEHMNTFCFSLVPQLSHERIPRI